MHHSSKTQENLDHSQEQGEAIIMTKAAIFILLFTCNHHHHHHWHYNHLGMDSADWAEGPHILLLFSYYINLFQHHLVHPGNLMQQLIYSLQKYLKIHNQNHSNPHSSINAFNQKEDKIENINWHFIKHLWQIELMKFDTHLIFLSNNPIKTISSFFPYNHPASPPEV